MSSATDSTEPRFLGVPVVTVSSVGPPLTESEKRLIELIQRNTRMDVWVDGRVMLGRARVGP